MAIKEDKVKSTVIIDGKQSINELGRLEMEAQDVRKQMELLKRAANDYAKTADRMKSLELAGKNQSKAYDNARKKLEGLSTANRQYLAQAQKYDQVTQKVEALRKKVGLVGMTMTQLRRTQRQLNQEFNNTTAGTEKYEKLKRKLQEVNGVIAQQRAEVRDTSTGFARFRKKLSGVWEVFAGSIGSEIAVGIWQAFIGFFSSAIDGAAKLSDELADVRKTTGLTTEEVAKFNKELSKIDTRTTSSNLREIARVGGQLGIAKEELLGFVEGVDKINVALGDEFQGGAEEVAAQMGKLRTLFKEVSQLPAGEAMERIGSAVNHLSSISSATAPEVAKFAKRMGTLGELGPSLNETLGLGAALTGDLGLSAEIASGGLAALFLQAGTQSQAFANQIGITKDEFEKLLNADPNAMLLRLAESFQGLENTQVAAALEKMKVGSQEAIKVMSLLANQTNVVKKQQEEANKAFTENTSILNEFTIKNNNLAAQLEKTKKKLNGIVMSVGSALAPALVTTLQLFTALLVALKETPKFIEENKHLFKLLAVAILSYNTSNIIATASTIANTAAEKGRAIALKVSTMWTNRAKLAQTALNFVLTANPIGLVVAALGTLVVGLQYLYENSKTARNIMNGLWNTIKEVGKIAKEVFTQFGQGISDILEGNITEGLKKVGTVLVKNNPTTIAFTQGKRLAKAYQDGYNEEEKKNQKNRSTISPELIAENKKRMKEELAKLEKEREDIAAEERAKANKKRAAQMFGGGDASKAKSNVAKSLGVPEKDLAAEASSVKTVNKLAEDVFKSPAEDPAILYALELAEEENKILEEQDNFEAELADKKRLRAEELAKKQLEIQQQKSTDEINLLHSTVQAAMGLFGQNTTAFKILATTEAAINTYKAAQNALAQAPGPPATIPFAALAVATGLKNVAKINSIGIRTPQAQKPKPPSFYTGGKTGNKSLGYGDSFGEFAGYVHKDEYVIPSAIRKVPQVANMERAIESIRTNSFAQGGATSQGAGSTTNNNSLVNISPLISEIKALRADINGMNTKLKASFEWEDLKSVKEGLQDLENYQNNADI